MKHNLFRTTQERRSKPFLMLEIGMLHIRLHLIDAAKDPIRITVLREESMTPGDGSHFPDMIRRVLDVNTEVRDLALVLNAPSVRHQILSIPHMSRAERQRVLQLEMRNSSHLKEAPGVFSCWSAGKIKDPDTVREQVLCAEVSQSAADNLIAAAREKNFKLIGFTSYAQMASHILKECRIEGVHNIALLDAGDREGSITLFHSNIWNMERHFLLGGASASSDSQELSEFDAEKLKLEVGRALQYFKQQVRSENISQILLMGSSTRTAAIKALLESSFRISVVPVVLERKWIASDPGAGKDEKEPRLFDIAHATALYANFERYINFLPSELHGEEHFKTRRWILAASAAALYMLLGSVAFMMHQEASRIRARGQTTLPPASVQGTALQQKQEIQTLRSFALAAEQSDEWLRRKHSLLAALARDLASAAPPQMRITGLEATAKGESWRVAVNAEIRSPNGSNSQKLLLGFQDPMQRLACLKQLAWSDVQVTDGEPPADSADFEGSPGSLLTFTMTGILRKDSPSNTTHFRDAGVRPSS